jgi:hypothetical protein
VETMTGSSQKIIGGLAAYKADVALISEDLQDGPQAGVKVLQTLNTARRKRSPNAFVWYTRDKSGPATKTSSI